MRSPSALFSGAWDIFKQNAMLFLSIYIVPTIAVALITFLFLGDLENEANYLSLSDAFSAFLNAAPFILLAIVINVLMSIALTIAVINPSVQIAEAYQTALEKFLSYLWISILTGVIVFVGFVLFIIPGIIFAVWLAFSVFVLLVEGKGGVAALKQSKEYVTGKWMAVFGRILALLAVSIILGIIVGIVGSIGGEMGEVALSYILNFFLVPFSIAYMYLMYQDLKSTPESVGEAAPEVTEGSNPEMNEQHAQV